LPSLDDYLIRLRRLRSDTTHPWPAAARGRAPHKPFLLLSVLDSVEEGTLTRNLVGVTPELAETFALYWSKVMPPESRGSMAKPFFHLCGDGFWHLIPQSGQEAVLPTVPSVDSLSRLRTLVAGARLDEELWTLVCEPESRRKLRAALIEACFAPEVGPLLWEQSASTSNPASMPRRCWTARGHTEWPKFCAKGRTTRTNLLCAIKAFDARS
jgi:putative restriction endonuclease